MSNCKICNDKFPNEKLRIELPKLVENYEIDLALSYMNSFIQEIKDYKKNIENNKLLS
jgi:hypothetical protein